MESVTALLRFRGELVAAGAVALTTGVVLTLVRFDHQWAAFPKFVVALALALLVVGLAWLAPPVEVGGPPRTFTSVLLVAGFVALFVTLDALASVLGADGVSTAPTATWAGALLTGATLALAVLRRSAIMTLLGTASAVGTLLAFADWVFDPHSVNLYRWLLLVGILALAAGALQLRDRQPRHAVALVDVAGLSALGIGALSAAQAALGAFLSIGAGDGIEGPRDLSAGTWWELVTLLLGFALVAYAAVDREPGPAYLGVSTLLLFVVVAVRGDSLLGWPILLVAVGGGAMAFGLRPTTPAPPAPDAGAPPAPTVAHPTAEPPPG